MITAGVKRLEANGIHNGILIQLCIELRVIKKRPVKFTGRFFVFLYILVMYVFTIVRETSTSVPYVPYNVYECGC